MDQLYGRAMITRKGYKYRLQANTETRQKLAQFAGACRFVWNKVLALNVGRYQAGVPRLTYGEAAGALPLWKQSEDYGFLHVPSAAMYRLRTASFKRSSPVWPAPIRLMPTSTLPAISSRPDGPRVLTPGDPSGHQESLPYRAGRRSKA